MRAFLTSLLHLYVQPMHMHKLFATHENPDGGDGGGGVPDRDGEICKGRRAYRDAPLTAHRTAAGYVTLIDSCAEL